MANEKKTSLLEFFALEEHCGHCEEDLEESEQPRAAHANGDSKWSDPFASRERMPHEEPHSEPQEKSANAWVDQRPCQKLKDFFGGQPFPKGKKVHEAEEPKKPKVGDVVKGQQKADLSDEYPFDDDDELDFDDIRQQVADLDAQRQASEQEPQGPKPEWDTSGVTQADVDKLTIHPPPKSAAPKQTDVWQSKPAAERVPGGPLPPPAGIQPPSEEDMSWDEFRATEPDVAADLERDTTPEELQGGHFQKREDGRIYFISTSGKRWGYLGNRYGWEEMEFDGETPSGEA